MEYIKEYTSKSLDEVLVLVCNDKHCQVDDIKYTIIDEKKGLLGIGNSITISAYTNNDIKEFLFDYIGNYFIEADIEAEMEVQVHNQDFKIIVDAENNPVLIGKNGNTLAAFNNVIKSACNNYFNTRLNILLDIGSYKTNKYQRILKTAIRTAKIVAKTKVDAALDPMTNDERKLVHQKLDSFKNISTISVGEGKHRHLVIRYQEDN